MRTVGEILKKRRFEKNLSLEWVESKIKIRKKFLQALENNDWLQMPSLPYIKGFLKVYADFLDLNSEELLAVFRRHYNYEEKSDILPEGVSQPLNRPLVRFTPQTIIAVISALFLLFLFSYLGLQYIASVSPPNLTVERPKEGEVLSSPNLQIKGKTDIDAVVEINKKRIALNDKGEFATMFTLQPGVNTVVVDSISKFGKKKTVTRTVSVEQPLNAP